MVFFSYGKEWSALKTEQLGPYTLTWPDGVFPLGSDALALGEFATLRPRWKVCDLGTGSGALLLLLARRESTISLTGVESDELSARTAQNNLQANHLPGAIFQQDLRKTDLPAGSFDLVISNPPYFAAGSGKGTGQARHEEQCSLPELCTAAARLLRNGGRFALCHRPERLADIFCALRAAHLEPKRMKLVSHSPAHPPFLVLVEAVRQGRPGLTVEP